MHPDHRGGRSPSNAMYRYPRSAGPLFPEAAGALSAAGEAAGEAVEVEAVEAFLGSAPAAVGTYSH